MKVSDISNSLRSPMISGQTSVATPERREWDIVGLMCPADAVLLGCRLRHLPGVISVVVNPVTERAYLSFDSRLVSGQELRTAINRLGYQAR